MPIIDTLVIGAGQAGLAASWHLAARGIDHVVLDRGATAQRWRTERWDSLRLLTPNWLSRLPGWSYQGPDPDGFMSAAEVAAHLGRYAGVTGAPVVEHCPVERLTRTLTGFDVLTTGGHWRAGNVIVATGWCDLPAVPPMARYLDPGTAQVPATAYRNPDSLPGGGVLVVGASASGVQIAAELAASGRPVVLAVGAHTRLPRRYRGRDIYWWLDRLGTLDRPLSTMPDKAAARREVSLQLTGDPDGREVGLDALRASGVELTGRLRWLDGHRVGFADDLPVTVAAAEVAMGRVLTSIDDHLDRTGTTAPPPVEQAPVRIGPHPERLHLRRRGITAVVWATGHRRAYPWLDIRVLDGDGEIRNSRGVTPIPGLYVLGQRFQQRRNSNFLDGVGRDAAFVVDHLSHRGRSTTPHLPTHSRKGPHPCHRPSRPNSTT